MPRPGRRRGKREPDGKQTREPGRHDQTAHRIDRPQGRGGPPQQADTRAAWRQPGGCGSALSRLPTAPNRPRTDPQPRRARPRRGAVRRGAEKIPRAAVPRPASAHAAMSWAKRFRKHGKGWDRLDLPLALPAKIPRSKTWAQGLRPSLRADFDRGEEERDLPQRHSRGSRIRGPNSPRSTERNPFGRCRPRHSPDLSRP